MTPRITSVAVFAISLCLIGTTRPATAQLNGNYTIGSVPSNYATIADAVADLHGVGIDGPVTFQIWPDTYDEQIEISHFERFGNPDDLVTFEPLSGTVTWQASAATAGKNHVVLLDSASYIKFNDLDFEAVVVSVGRLIVMDNLTSHITITNSRLTGMLGATNATSLIWGWGYEIVIEDNDFTRGAKGISMKISTAPGSIEKYTVRRNTFGGQTEYGILLTYADTAFVGLNTVNSAAWSSADYKGIRVDFDDFARITRNTVDMQLGNEGISMSGGSGGIGSRVANNMVALRASAATSPMGIEVDADNVDVYHNTVRTTQTTGEALKVTSSASNVSVLNNIFAADGGGLAMYVEDAAAIDSSNYNILYSSGTHITQWEFTLNATIDDHREDSFRDFASYKTAVTFVSTSGTNDLHLAAPSDSDVRLIGPPRNGVIEDIDGDARTNFTVTRGADEGQPFSPLDNGDTGLGYYTAGGNSPDFAGPAVALRHLRLRGMKGPVTIRVRPGTYEVQRIIDPTRFLGSEADTVLIRASDPSNRPLFQVASGSTFQNYSLRIVDQTAIQIRNINFEATGTPPFGRLIQLVGDVDRFKLTKCSLTGFAGETSLDAALLYGVGFNQDEVQIANCSFNGGSYGAWLATTSGSDRGEDSSIKKSRFDDQKVAGIYSNHTDLLVQDDTVTSSRTDFVGIHIDGAIRPEVISSVVYATGTGSIGLLMDDGNGSVTNPTPIRNNFLTARHAGMKIENDARVFGLYHNTIRGQEYGLFVDADAGPALTFVNNIIVNTGTDPALYVGQPADVDSSDFNNLTNDGGGTLVEWATGTYSTLGAYQVTGYDQNSVSKPVDFVDQASGDLHLDGASVGDTDLAGTPIESVSDDIDGDARSSIAPYMGADEASTPLALGITVDLDVFLEGPYNGSAMNAALNDDGHLAAAATTHPFSAAPWNYGGPESVAAGFFAANPTIVDWVLCVLYSGTLPSVTPIDTIAAFVLEDGTVVSHSDGSSDPLFDVAAGMYHLAVFARNHLGVISSSQVDLTTPSPAYDFTDGLSKAYGVSPMQDLGGGDYGLFSGDFDADGQVIANDFNAWLTDTKAGATGYLASDFNMDGQVNAADFNTWLANTKAGAASQVP